MLCILDGSPWLRNRGALDHFDQKSKEDCRLNELGEYFSGQDKKLDLNDGVINDYSSPMPPDVEFDMAEPHFTSQNLNHHADALQTFEHYENLQCRIMFIYGAE